jgi:two-component system phosphate regulon sensor histidine kinase PhoR
VFKEAKIRLTIFYSILFLVIFWVFSFGLYFWVANSFGESYVSQVKEQQQIGQFEDEFDDKDDENEERLLNIAGEVAIEKLLNMLLILNGGLLIIIPVVAWILTRHTLTPLQQIHEQQKQFVSDVSHELRTPLSIMSGEIEITLRKPRQTNEYIQILTSSKEELSHLINLVKNLLFLAKEDQKAISLQSEKVDLTDLLNNVISTLKEKINKKKIILKLKLADESITIIGQASMLRQLFFNIIDNAIIYTPENGKINIALSANTNQVIIKVIDTGIGIAPKEQKKVFERFYRVDSSRSQTKGYGLGLAICQSIVSIHKGHIDIASKLGKGTAVTVFLPRF